MIIVPMRPAEILISVSPFSKVAKFCIIYMQTIRRSEEAHRRLMRCFFERGQSYMALRQYHLCVEALKEGLNVAPAYATKELYEFIRRHS